MAKVRFYARGDLRVIGFPEFIGRKRDEAGEFPATLDPVEVESESQVGQKLIKLTRRDGALWPADEATARICSVAFIPVEFKPTDSTGPAEWVAKTTTAKSPQAKAAAE